MSYLKDSCDVHPWAEAADGETALRLVAGKRCETPEASRRTLAWFLETHENMDHNESVYDQIYSNIGSDVTRNRRRNPFHDAAEAGNESFLYEIMTNGATAPDYERQVEESTFNMCGGSFYQAFRFQFDPYCFNESILPLA
jgi:hypothetical protein